VVPKARELLGDSSSNSEALGKVEALHQLKFTFRAFLRSVCSQNSPVVLFIDDLQWIDLASLDLLKSLLTDKEIKNFLFVGAYRDNEVDDVHPLMISLRNLEKHHEMYKIKLGNLDQSSVYQLVADLLRSDVLEVEPLADIVCRRTHGNVFFVLQLLKMLHEESLLYFSVSSFRWEWDVDKILAGTNASDNVVDLVVANMHKKLSGEVEGVLKIASCLGTSFDLLVLWRIIKGRGDMASITSVKSVDELVQLLEMAAVEGIIEKTRRNAWYKFSHDSFLHACMTMYDTEARISMHYRIGQLLWPEGTLLQSGDAWKLFIAVDQLNKGSEHVTEVPARIHLANLNLAAGEMASRVSAHVPAIEYFTAGVLLLPAEGRWEKHYKLCLNLHSSAAEVTYLNGDFKECEQMCEEILKNAKDDMDKMRAILTRVDSLGAQQKLEAAVLLSFDVLRTTLGEPFSKNMNRVHVLAGLVKTARMLHGKSDGELLSLPLMTDEAKIAAMKLLLSITHHAYFLQKPVYLALAIFRMVQLTLRYGLDKLSASGFASYGLVRCGVLGKIKEGYRFGKLALTLIDRLDAQEWKAQVVCVCNQCLFHWQEPFTSQLEPLLQAYQLGHERVGCKVRIAERW
jgi:predicted ATPase